MPDRLLRPGFVLAVLVAAGFLAVVLWPDLLLLLGVPLRERWFLDSYAILAANDAIRQGLDVATGNVLDLLNRPHVYSDWWLGLRWLGLTRDDNFAFGGGIVAVFFVAVAAAARPRSPGAALWLLAVLLSPAFLFGVHRANNDLVVFALLGGALYLLRDRPTPLRVAAFGAVLVLGTGLKYYPIVAVGALLAVLPWRKATLATVGVAGVLSLAVLFSERHSLGRGMFVMSKSIYEFGAPILWRNLGVGRAATVFLSTALLALGAMAVARQGWTSGLASPARGPQGERLMFAVGACLLVGCFLAGESHFYRLIFSLWLWPWGWREAAAGGRVAQLGLALSMLALWLDGICCLVVNSLGLDYRPDLGWRILLQGIVWSWMLLLAGWLWEGFLQRWREWRNGTVAVETSGE